MKKIDCYPKYIIYLPLVLSFVLIIFSLAPTIIATNDSTTIKLVWSLLMLFLSLSCFIGHLWMKQSLFIEDDVFVVRNCFCIIKSLKTNDVYLQVSELPTYSSWVVSVNLQWICIYEKSNYVPRFKNGGSNSRRYNRIQVVYSDSNFDFISKSVDDSTEKHKKKL